MSDLLQHRLLEDRSLRPSDIQWGQLQGVTQQKTRLKYGDLMEWILEQSGLMSQQQMPLEEPLLTSTPTS